MKETGLMFKAPLVRAILSGQKTQTRRIVKWRDLHPGLNLGFSGLKVFSNVPNTFTLESHARNGWESRSSPTRCPMGQPGDRIYVRETFCYQWSDERGWLDECWFRATTPDVEHPDGGEKSPWKPAIHMPKSASRLWLEITGVRVERLQQITEADCIAEGIEFFNNDRECGCKNYMDKTGKDWTLTAHQSFRSLWESTGGEWAANPYVWVIDFKPTPKEPA